MSSQALQQAMNFMENEKQFHLGFLPTEQSNPLTANLDGEFAKSSVAGVANLQSVDRNVLTMIRRVLTEPAFARLVSTGTQVIRSGGHLVFSGCGATGRLSILLESMWREACAGNTALAPYSNQVFSIMTGGDFALVKSVEFFEDYQIFGRRQVQDMGMKEGDMLVAITEGGETSSVLGSVFEALDRKASVFLMFNNPADLLAEHLERSRQAIRDPRVCVLDLSCGPMALAGSTRMQATTSEQLVAGAALEAIVADLLGLPQRNIIQDFEDLLEQLEQPAARQAMAGYIDFEADIYRQHGMVTYFANDYLLDIFTDTTERSPTFMLPPFRKCDDTVSPQSWAFVKNPLYSTPDTWQHEMNRPLRCLEWTPEDYRDMGTPEAIVANPPKIKATELLKIQVGNEHADVRSCTGRDAAVLVTVTDQQSDARIFHAFSQNAETFHACKHLAVGGTAGDFIVPCNLPQSPLQLMAHMAIKLTLNTISTGVMAVLGRITGNWMSWVDVTNKKLMDRGIRLICEIGQLDYKTACIKLHEALETIQQQQQEGDERPSAVQVVLQELKH